MILITSSKPHKTDFLASFHTCRSRDPGEAAPGSTGKKHAAVESPGRGGMGSVPQVSRKAVQGSQSSQGAYRSWECWLGKQERLEEEAGGQARTLRLRDLRNCSFKKMTAS